jgi:hypothetical protein
MPDSPDHTQVYGRGKTIVVEVGVQGFPGAGTGAPPNRIVLVPTDGQSTFTLPSAPTLPHLSQLFINTTKALYIRDYTIDGLLLRWVGDFPIQPTDQIEFLFN